MADYVVTLKGADAVLRKLDPRLYQPALVELLTSAALTAEVVAKNGAPTDTAALARSITSQVTPPTARVFSTLAYAPVVELGRTPGAAPPPPDALVGWMRRHGMTGDPWRLARAIGRRGIRGRFFFRAAAQATIRALPGLLDRAVGRVEAAWSAR